MEVEKERVKYLPGNIRYLRKRDRLTQQDLADKVGIKRSSIGAYEENRAEPALRVLIKMAEVFNTSLDELTRTKLSAGEKKTAKQGKRHTPEEIAAAAKDFAVKWLGGTPT